MNINLLPWRAIRTQKITHWIIGVCTGLILLISLATLFLSHWSRHTRNLLHTHEAQLDQALQAITFQHAETAYEQQQKRLTQAQILHRQLSTLTQYTYQILQAIPPSLTIQTLHLKNNVFSIQGQLTTPAQADALRTRLKQRFPHANIQLDANTEQKTFTLSVNPNEKNKIRTPL